MFDFDMGPALVWIPALPLTASAAIALLGPRLLRQHTEGAIAEWASQLQKLGLIESLPMPQEHDLDFTGSLRLAQS